jgi:hypothetical protein
MLHLSGNRKTICIITIINFRTEIRRRSQVSLNNAWQPRNTKQIFEDADCTGFWWGNLRERDHWGDPDVDGRIILGWTCRKWDGVVGFGWTWLRIGTGGGHL